ncbi:MAG: NAD(P)H-dependent glycerol-3-phosphate dehydrogenase [Chitinophagales bacterium]|nr:NAD(P)H-dependent glycerol-3-phosphate dehydrogenase [Chitinophagales bacterium]
MSEQRIVGVIGAGSFGTALANLIAENHHVLLYIRRKENLERITTQRVSHGQALHERVTPIVDLKQMAEQCTILFPTVPSAFFRDTILQMVPYLRPDHVMIHGTKGFHINVSDEDKADEIRELGRGSIQTMSELIRQETPVVRVGCISGPNLASELAHLQPAGTVIASHFDEVIKEGRAVLRSHRFQVFASNDLIGVELAGALKNIIAIASGALSGLELGDNARALLITKSLGELIRIGAVLGADQKTFLGMAGIGDIIATASSKHSRNFTVGYRMAKGESLEQILATSDEVAEGINTVEIVKLIADYYKVRVPIIQMIYRVLFDQLPVAEAVKSLMKYPFDKDVDFID